MNDEKETTSTTASERVVEECDGTHEEITYGRTARNLMAEFDVDEDDTDEDAAGTDASRSHTYASW